MSKATKALIITWVLIGILAAGGIGFYLGKTTATKVQQGQPPGLQNQDGLRSGPQPTGIQQPLKGGFEQQPQGIKQEPLPSGVRQGGQQNQPPNGGQPIQ